MAYSLGLTLYNLANRAKEATSPPRPPRPQGPLIWLQAAGPDSVPQLLGLARRLEEDHGVNVVLSSATAPQKLPAGVIWQPNPIDNATEARALLDYWTPDLIAQAEGELRPALLHEAHARQIPSALIDARSPAILRGREGWWPGLMRGLLSSFNVILAIDETAARAFRRAGAEPKSVLVTGRMEYPSTVLPCYDGERTELATLLATRPVWFAASLPESEEEAVIAAHRSAMKLAHRLLLILSPQTAERIPALVTRMEQEEGWTVACRHAEEEPDSDVQVYIADPESDYGLWYRLAPITYFGGGLDEAGIDRDPMEAAALGSAIIHGPRAGAFGASLGRLAAAQATCLVVNGHDLGVTLGELLSPDRAARLAQAAWAVESDGAEATQKVVDALCKLLKGAK